MNTQAIIAATEPEKSLADKDCPHSHIPNQTTIEAMEEALNGKLHKCGSIKEMMVYFMSDED